MKRRIDRISKSALLVSVILDIGMFILCGFSIHMCLTVKPNSDCSKAFTMTLAYAVTIVSIARCSHIILILLLLCAVPCFLCKDTCCIKKRLVKRKATPKAIISELEAKWSWQQGPHRIIFATNCLLCLCPFEPG